MYVKIIINDETYKSIILQLLMYIFTNIAWLC